MNFKCVSVFHWPKKMTFSLLQRRNFKRYKIIVKMILTSLLLLRSLTQLGVKAYHEHYPVMVSWTSTANVPSQYWLYRQEKRQTITTESLGSNFNALSVQVIKHVFRMNKRRKWRHENLLRFSRRVSPCYVSVPLWTGSYASEPSARTSCHSKPLRTNRLSSCLIEKCEMQ